MAESGVEEIDSMSAKPKHNPPHGMEPYDVDGQDDLGALSTDQQRKLNEFKIKTRLENEAYLRRHPEIDCMIQSFIGEALIQRPENLKQFAAEFFTDPELSKKVEQRLEERHQTVRMNDVMKQL